MTVAVAGGTREVDVPRLLRSRPALDDAQIVEMARLAHDLEGAMGWPVDLEVAYRGDALYLLQCRPITTLGTAARPEASAGNAVGERNGRSGPYRQPESRPRTIFRPQGGDVSQVDTREATAARAPRAGAAPIPAPPGFPVAWERPDDEQRFWEQERTHFPTPIIPLDYSLMDVVYSRGFNAAAEHYGLPIRGPRPTDRRVHVLLDGAAHPAGAAGGAGEDRRGADQPGHGQRSGERWEREWLPEIQRHLAELRAYDLAGAATAGPGGPPRRDPASGWRGSGRSTSCWRSRCCSG